MEFYRKLLARLPDPRQVQIEASAKYPGRPELADVYAAGLATGYYTAARSALAALVERVEREDALRADPFAPMDDPPLVARIAGPDASVLADLEVPPLSVVDPEAVDLGAPPHATAPATDARTLNVRG